MRCELPQNIKIARVVSMDSSVKNTGTHCIRNHIRMKFVAAEKDSHTYDVSNNGKTRGAYFRSTVTMRFSTINQLNEFQ